MTPAARNPDGSESLGEKMTKQQNTSYAVMAQRREAQDSLDDFPTPPWATRALIEHVLGGKERVKSQVCLEPACGPGHMAKVLSEYFGKVTAADIHPYGYGRIQDFLATPHETNSFDWVITNPPFRLGEDFTLRALKLARRGVATRTQHL
jgi:type I restriction-modification system DNA methylase subunit